MNKREIVTLMHKLFPGDIDKSNGYEHIYKDDELDETMLNNFLAKYINTDNVFIYVNSQNAFECKTPNIYKCIQPHVKNERIRIATPDFNVKIITELTGVAAGSITNRST